jgi:hypothetical protein
LDSSTRKAVFGSGLYSTKTAKKAVQPHAEDLVEPVVGLVEAVQIDPP